MPKISDFIAHPDAFGQICILPHPRAGTPFNPFKVIEADIKPDSRYGTMTRENRDIHGRPMPNTRLIKGDLLMHSLSGVVAHVVERITDHTFRIEAWGAPESELDKENWMMLGALGGEWIVWGRAYENYNDLPLGLIPAEEVRSDHPDFQAARRDIMRHPERQPWAADVVAKHWSKLKGKEKKKLRQQLRALLGAQKQLKADGADRMMDENRYLEKTTKLGGKVVKWRISPDGIAEAPSE